MWCIKQCHSPNRIMPQTILSLTAISYMLFFMTMKHPSWIEKSCFLFCILIKINKISFCQSCYYLHTFTISHHNHPMTVYTLTIKVCMTHKNYVRVKFFVYKCYFNLLIGDQPYSVCVYTTQNLLLRGDPIHNFTQIK